MAYDEMDRVKEKAVVTIRYSMKNAEGEVIESIFGSEGVEYLHGSGTILPQLENGLTGMRAGESRTIYFTDETDESSYTMEILVDHIRKASEGELISGLPGRNRMQEICGLDCIC